MPKAAPTPRFRTTTAGNCFPGPIAEQKTGEQDEEQN